MHLKMFSLSLMIGPKFWPPQTHPYPGTIFLKFEPLHSWLRGKVSTKNEVDCLIQTHTDRKTHTCTHKTVAINPWRGLMAITFSGICWTTSWRPLLMYRLGRAWLEISKNSISTISRTAGYPLFIVIPVWRPDG